MANKVTITNTTNTVTITQNAGNNINPVTSNKPVTINTSTPNVVNITSQGAIGPAGPPGLPGNASIFGNHYAGQLSIFRSDNGNEIKGTWRPQVSGYTVLSPPSFDPHIEAGTPSSQYNNNDYFGYGKGTPRNSSFVMDSLDFPVQLYNPFQNYSQNRFFDSIRSNRFHGKSKKIAVSYDGGSFQEEDRFFNGNYDSSRLVANAGEKTSINLDFIEYGLTGNSGYTYPEGRLHLNFYYFNGPREVSASLHYKNPGTGVETTRSVSFEPYDFQSHNVAGSYHSWRATVSSTNYLRGIKLHITASDERPTNLTQIEYIGRRMTYGEAGDLSREGGYVKTLTLSDEGLFFEGSVEDNFETKLTAINPTADRTITFPDTTGNVILNTSASFVTDITTTGNAFVNAIRTTRNTSTWSRNHFTLHRPTGSNYETGAVGVLNTAVNGTYTEAKGYRLYLTNTAGGLGYQTQHLAIMQNGDVEIDSKNSEQNMNLSGSAKLYVGGNIRTSGNIITNDVTLSSDGNANGSSAALKLQGLGNTNNLQESTIKLDSYGGSGGQAIIFNNDGGKQFRMHGTSGFYSTNYYMVGHQGIKFQQNYLAAEDSNGDTAFTFNNGYEQPTGYLFTVSLQNDPHFRIGNSTGSIELLKPVTASGNISSSGNINAQTFFTDYGLFLRNSSLNDLAIQNETAGTGYIRFLTKEGGTNVIKERMRIQNSGTVTMGSFGSTDARLNVFGTVSASGNIITTDITASGDISASGDINATNFLSDPTLNKTNFGEAFIKSGTTPSQLHLGLGNSQTTTISTRRHQLDLAVGTETDGSGGTRAFKVSGSVIGGGAFITGKSSFMGTKALKMFLDNTTISNTYLGVTRPQQSDYFATNTHKLIGPSSKDYEHADSASLGTAMYFTSGTASYPGLLLSGSGDIHVLSGSIALDYDSMPTSDPGVKGTIYRSSSAGIDNLLFISPGV